MADIFNNHRNDALVLLRKESLDLFNRVHSIADDVQFVEEVCQAYPDLPVLPNLRCGAWYVSPKIASQYDAYFKSTDGHYNNWNFNLRRPNIHLLSVILQHGGLILVDSTRAGKRMPDALSKTVPIWCAVINRAVKRAYRDEDGGGGSGSERGWDDGLYTPPGVIPAQEHTQIEKKIEEWADALVNSSYALPLLTLPLRPMWITPSTSVFPSLPPVGERKFCPVICVSASKQVGDGIERRSSGFAYVQGSGDDHELWGMGLTPQMFWEEKDTLLQAQRAELPDVVAEIVAKHQSRQNGDSDWAILPTSLTKSGGRLLITALSAIPSSLPPSLPNTQERLAYVLISTTLPSTFVIPEDRKRTVLLLEMAEGKKGQTQFLHSVLPRSVEFIRKQLADGLHVCVGCHNGKDASVGVVLAALQLFFGDDGVYRGSSSVVGAETLSKKSLNIRLQWIIADRPEANPSRVTLKRVNEFLLTDPALRR
ncbi:initiator tRNA phosphoribosyl transferase [Cristinia sonorae]|uniref:Initiator tRNA phosphoribosyl transferase n=1 Tax=Cristinia sonorae TaxID=1940300 RepID=A0A8K0XSH1_9AGAR|nr:initiator tRNA phosphoribosyl transferase [Cristinia sonorae]